MKTENNPTDPDRSGDARRVVDLAGSIYSAYIDHGRAYLSPGDAVRTAACIIGMARSKTARELIDKSSNDLVGAERYMAGIRHRVAVQVEKDRQVAVEKFAQVLAGESEVAETQTGEAQV